MIKVYIQQLSDHIAIFEQRKYPLRVSLTSRTSADVRRRASHPRRRRCRNRKSTTSSFWTTRAYRGNCARTGPSPTAHRRGCSPIWAPPKNRFSRKKKSERRFNPRIIDQIDESDGNISNSVSRRFLKPILRRPNLLECKSLRHLNRFEGNVNAKVMLETSQFLRERVGVFGRREFQRI